MGVGEAGGDQLFGVHVIGREKDVLGVAAGDLLGEGRGGAEGSDDLDASGLLILGGERGKYRLKIGRSGDVKIFGGLRMRGWRPCEYPDKN